MSLLRPLCMTCRYILVDTMTNLASTNYCPVRTIRLPPEQIARILDELDVPTTGWHTARRDTRYKYRIHEVVVLMQQPGFAGPMAFIVPTRNISARGLSFLHGGYVHPGTLCVVQLVTTRGGQQNVVGTVRRCRYVQSNVHEVAVHFKTSIDPAAFCQDAVSLHVLIAEDEPSLVKLAKVHLGRLNCEMQQAADGPSALELAMSQTFDLILLDIDLASSDGLRVARELRERGFTGMIVAGSANDNEEIKKKAIEAGCDRCIVKPFGFEELSEITAALQSEPLFSDFHDDPSMADLVAEFVTELPVKLRLLEQAFAARDAATLRARAQDLKVEGRGFGFKEIANLAGQLEHSLDQGDSVDNAASHLRTLVRLCSQARSAVKGHPATVWTAAHVSPAVPAPPLPAEPVKEQDPQSQAATTGSGDEAPMA